MKKLIIYTIINSTIFLLVFTFTYDGQFSFDDEELKWLKFSTYYEPRIIPFIPEPDIELPPIALDNPYLKG